MQYASVQHRIFTTDLYKYSIQIPYLLFTSYMICYVATDKSPAQDGDKFRSILATIYNQSQLAERKHVARYWSINTAATAVPLSAHPSPLVITTKLAAAILGRIDRHGASSYERQRPALDKPHDDDIGRGVVRRRCSTGPVLPL